MTDQVMGGSSDYYAFMFTFSKFRSIIVKKLGGRFNDRLDITKRSSPLKDTYEKPILVKHEPLRDVMAGLETNENGINH